MALGEPLDLPRYLMRAYSPGDLRDLPLTSPYNASWCADLVLHFASHYGVSWPLASLLRLCDRFL